VTASQCNVLNLMMSWMQIVKRLFDRTTAAKVKFVFSNNAESMKILHTLFDKDKVESSLAADDFHFTEYASQMQHDDKRTAITWNLGG
jgi:hypothetical protein